jgi:hypothetical protein
VNARQYTFIRLICHDFAYIIFIKFKSMATAEDDLPLPPKDEFEDGSDS